MTTKEIRAFPNVPERQIEATAEFIVQQSDGEGRNITVAEFVEHVSQQEGIGLTTAEEAWLQSVEGSRPIDAGSSLPTDAHPDQVFLLTETQGQRGIGFYERKSGDDQPKVGFWTAYVTFAPASDGGVVWDRNNSLGSETGLPGEVARISVDRLGEEMTLLADTDTDPDTRAGPGNLNIEITEVGGGYAFTPDLDQQDFTVLDQEITFRGTVAPGIVAGKAYKLVLTTGSNDNAYWTPTGSLWDKIELAGDPGTDGEDGFSPVFAVVNASASAESQTGTRRILKIVDWIESTGDLEVGFSLYRGDYDSGVPYKKGDIVSSGSDFYVSIVADNQGNALSSTTHWASITADGASGGVTLPVVGLDDNGDILTVVNGSWAKAPAPSGGGSAGEDGQSPVLGIVSDRERRVLQVLDWIPHTGAQLQTVAQDGTASNIPFDGGFSDWEDIAPAFTSKTAADGMLNVVVDGTAKLRRSTSQDGAVNVSVEGRVSITSTAGVERFVSLSPRFEPGVWTASGTELDVTLDYTGSNIPVATGEMVKVQIRADRAGQTGRDLMDVRVGASTTVEWTVPNAPEGVFQYLGATGFVSDIADAVDIRGPAGSGGSGGGGLDQDAVDARTRALVNALALVGNTGRWPKDKLPTDTAYGDIPSDSDIDSRANARVNALVEKAARTSETLNANDMKAFRDRIDAEKAGRVDYVSQDLGGYNYAGSPRRDTAEDTGVIIPMGATRLLVSPLNDGNYAEIDVATLLALPNVTAGAVTNNTNSIDLFDESNFRIAHNDRDIYFVNASVQGPSETVDFVAHLPKLEPYADRATPTDRAPKSRLPSDTSYRTDSDIETLADGRIIPAARTGSTARFEKAKLPSDTAYGTIPPASRLLPAVTAADNDDILKVVSGAWAKSAPAASSGGGLGSIVTASKSSQTNIRNTSWTDVMSYTVPGGESTRTRLVVVNLDGEWRGSINGYVTVSYRLVRRASGASSDDSSPYAASSQTISGPASSPALEVNLFAPISLQAGDIVKVQARIFASTGRSAVTPNARFYSGRASSFMFIV